MKIVFEFFFYKKNHYTSIWNTAKTKWFLIKTADPAVYGIHSELSSYYMKVTVKNDFMQYINGF